MDRKMKIKEFYDILSRKIGRIGIFKGTTNFMLKNFISTSVFFGFYETYKYTSESF